MHTQLPTALEVETSIAAWRVEQPRLDALLNQQVPQAKALRLLAFKLWNEQRLESAIGMLAACAALAPGEELAWNDLASAYLAASRPDDARACLSASLSTNDRQPQGWLLLATIDSNAGNDSEAENAFLRALELAPQLADAAAGLGLLYFRQRRFTESAQWLQSAASLGSQIPFVQACLGQALYLIGDFSGAAAAFTVQLSSDPENANVLQKLARARLIETLIDGEVADALAVYHATAGAHTEDIETVTRKAFHLLSGYGHYQAAVRLGVARGEMLPDDPMQRYLLAALAGEPLSRAPDDYIVDYFDRFAKDFDTQLVEVLGYRVPEKLHALLEATGRKFPRILDVGCGTGLAGPLLRSLGTTLTGVDLAPAMLKIASERKVYDHLIEGNILTILEHGQERYDLVLAADVLIYVGDLATLIPLVARSLESGGIFAFSIETTSAADFVLLPSGRFAHRMSYIEELSKDDFIVTQTEPTTIRLEANKPVAGALIVLQRR